MSEHKKEIAERPELDRYLSTKNTEYNEEHHARHEHKGKSDYVFYSGLWFLWLLTGTFFYGFAKNSDLGFLKGFYMAVNIGYSVGWGFPIENFENYLYFSSIFVIIGASLVAVALGFFADKIIEDADNWYVNLIQKAEYKKDTESGQPLMTKIQAFVIYHQEAVRAVLIWLAWIAIMIFYSMVHIKWPFKEAQYFAISSCSTGGHWGIPNDSEDWLFGVTGFFVALGVPIMGVAMASIAKVLQTSGDIESIKDTLSDEVTDDELGIMRKLGLEDGDGQIDKSEFIVLCMMRLGTDPNVVEFIINRFKELDVDGNGTLNLNEISGKALLESQKRNGTSNRQEILEKALMEPQKTIPSEEEPDEEQHVEYVHVEYA